MNDCNAHAHHADVERPNCALSMCWTRDPLDGAPIGEVLDALARRRGRAHVFAAVHVWAAGGFEERSVEVPATMEDS